MRIRNYYDEQGELREEIILTFPEQRSWYDQCVKMILNNTGYVLEHIDDLPEFKVSWEDYHNKAKQKIRRKEYYQRTGK